MNTALAWVEIDRQALRHNFKEARRLAQLHLQPRLNRGIDLLAVVKADAYGHGMLEAVRAFAKEGSRFFAVSNIDEALQLRAVSTVRILALESCLPELAPLLVKNNITPAIGSLAFARAMDRAAGRARKLVPIHIEVDTGMGRLGVWHEEVPAFAAAILKLKNIYIEGFMTHFPVADSDRKYTEKQAELFSTVVADLIREGVSFKYLHAANSMGLAGYRNRYFNLVRPGVMLYGLYPDVSLRRAVDLKPVMSVKARVLMVKEIEKGRGISYGHTYRAPRRLTAAVISIGYSDGYRRAFSGKAHVLINGRPCSVLGRVTMDQTIVDVSAAGDVRVRDEVTVIGRQGKHIITMDDLAAWAGTINYEIACNLGNRLPRNCV